MMNPLRMVFTWNHTCVHVNNRCSIHRKYWKCTHPLIKTTHVTHNSINATGDCFNFIFRPQLFIVLLHVGTCKCASMWPQYPAVTTHMYMYMCIYVQCIPHTFKHTTRQRCVCTRRHGLPQVFQSLRHRVPRQWHRGRPLQQRSVLWRHRWHS